MEIKNRLLLSLSRFSVKDNSKDQGPSFISALTKL